MCSFSKRMEIIHFLTHMEIYVDDNDENDELFLQNGWLTKGIEPYF